MIITLVVGLVSQPVPARRQQGSSWGDLELGVFAGRDKPFLRSFGVLGGRDSAGYRPNPEKPDIPAPELSDRREDTHPAMMD